MSTLRFLGLLEIKERTGLSKTEIYRRMEVGTFPRPIQLGKRAVAWRSDELDAWMSAKIEQANELMGRQTSGQQQRPPVTDRKAAIPTFIPRRRPY